MMWHYNNITWQIKKRRNCRIFRTAHRPLACHGAGMLTLSQGKPSVAQPSFGFAQACRHPTMRPSDIDDKYDFIHLFSRNRYE
jgi:hypothetical protein